MCFLNPLGFVQPFLERQFMLVQAAQFVGGLFRRGVLVFLRSCQSGQRISQPQGVGLLLCFALVGLALPPSSWISCGPPCAWWVRCTLCSGAPDRLVLSCGFLLS